MGSRRTRRSGPGRARVGLVPIIAALGSVVIPVFGSPAGAHLCAVTSIIRPGETAAVPISVTVERNAVADVEITFPAGLRLERFVARRPGWTATRSGAVVRVRGPEIPAYSCAYFSAAVTPLRRDVYRITMVQRDRSGAVVARSTPGLPDPANPFGAQRVYAGVDPPSPPSEGADPVVIAGITLIAVALLAAGGRAAFTVRSRRREARDAELDDRIGAFLSEPADPPVAPPPPGDGAPPSR